MATATTTGRNTDGCFRFFEDPVHLKREEAYEGKYVIQTEEPQLTAVEAVQIYKALSEVERAFANLKDVIEMRLGEAARIPRVTTQDPVTSRDSRSVGHHGPRARCRTFPRITPRSGNGVG